MLEVDSYTLLADLYDEVVVDPTYPRWAAYLDRIWSADAAGVGAVLDVCCGTGLMAAELASLGYRVVGVDASESMLERARVTLGPDHELHRATLPELAVTETFDAVISTFDGFNYLSPADLEGSLSALAARLRPGGWLVFDLHTDAMMMFTASNPVVEGEQGGYSFKIESDVDSSRRTCTSVISVAKATGVKPFREEHRQYFHSQEAIATHLDDAGFCEVSVSEEYTASPLASDTLRATWVARRPDGAVS